MATNQSAGERAFEISADINGFDYNGSGREQPEGQPSGVRRLTLGVFFSASGKLNDSMKPLLHRWFDAMPLEPSC